MAKKKIISDSHHITITFMVFILILCAVLYSMYFMGVLDGRSGEALGVANMICLLTGNFDGVDDFKAANNTYSFNCSKQNVTVNYSIVNNKGFVKWPKG